MSNPDHLKQKLLGVREIGVSLTLATLSEQVPARVNVFLPGGQLLKNFSPSSLNPVVQIVPSAVLLTEPLRPSFDSLEPQSLKDFSKAIRTSPDSLTHPLRMAIESLLLGYRPLHNSLRFASSLFEFGLIRLVPVHQKLKSWVITPSKQKTNSLFSLLYWNSAYIASYLLHGKAFSSFVFA
ncbi:hypothetical protein CROQUDRAFT_97713 [Cronartium quercuum f. sp. fusiforme G11]|uniref:Uncharacterized protein n=1 Tax=Cronartium quercuum f. sp. fusiforme G11 TaxID=708437 RepID=A0A9P6N979_9BASI|nr:hypothetical protein CROQUDRAFT_97713 [Cronartium quercuum f. sp. fusiforme G11]